MSASALTQDFYKAFLNSDARDRNLLWLGRAGVIAIALVAGWLARDPKSTVLGPVAYAWAGFGAGFGPAIILSLYWPRMTRNGALAGMLAGATTVVAWAHYKAALGGIYEILPGFAAGCCAIIAVSLLDRAPDSEIAVEFAKAQQAPA